MKWLFILISFLVGLLSLGEEIVWVKIVSFMGHSVPQSFSYVLFCYIGGIALGAFFGPRIIRFNYSPLAIMFGLLLFSGLSVLFSPSIIKYFYGGFFTSIVLAVLIVIGAAFKGAIFPLLHHWFTSPGVKLGRSLSLVYFANVMGSSLGPLLVGFWLLDVFSMFTVLSLLATFELILATVIVCLITKRVTAFVVCGVLTFSTVLLTVQSGNVLKGMLIKTFPEEGVVSHVIENRHGVIYTYKASQKATDIVYGGNVYDGGFNIDLVTNTNGIDRAFLLAALQPAPKRILVIGLSSGSWLRVISAFKGVELIDVVEINTGYAELIGLYPGASDIFNDERISINYTDGRKFVREAINSNSKYDLIVMNTTWYWRSYSTNLLSAEFMSMLRAVMNENAVAAFNSTGSLDVFYTANTIFDYAYLYHNFIYISDHDIRKTLNINSGRMCELDSLRLDGQSCADTKFSAAIDKLSISELLNWNEISKASLDGRAPELVTDNNMIIEYRYGANLFF